MKFDALLRRPIIVLGAPRSGTTLLANLLGNHPDVLFFGEPRLTWRWGNDDKSDMLTAADATDRVVAHIRETFGAQIAEAGRQRMLEKTPSNSLRVPFIEKVFPDALYVHIIRDGIESSLAINSRWTTHSHGFKLRREVIARHVREIRARQIPYYVKEVMLRLLRSHSDQGRVRNVWGPRIPGAQELLKDLEPIDVAALQWRFCVEAACHDGRKLGPERYYECQLEDLNEHTIGEIMSFCDLSPEPAVMKAFRAEFDRKAASHRRDEASQESIERIQRWIAPTTQWLEGSDYPARPRGLSVL